VIQRVRAGAIWNGRFTDDERRAMIEAVDGKLNELINAPDRQTTSRQAE
jgi:hypothetical protein